MQEGEDAGEQAQITLVQQAEERIRPVRFMP